jgi:plastocyanin
MKKFFLLFAAGFLSAGIVSAADITGTITLKGTPPKEVEIAPIMDDANCGQLYSSAPTTHFYVVGKNGELGDVIVSLKNADGTPITGKSSGASAKAAVMDQKGCLYLPQILAIQTGQKLIVKNSDNCVHNVHSVTSGPNAPDHNDAQMPGGADLTYTFAKPEPFLKFQCDVHPWMFAWVSIFDHPYFSISAKDGSFTIKNVPPGKYTLEASHRKLGLQSQVIDVKDQAVKVQFTFEVK